MKLVAIEHASTEEAGKIKDFLGKVKGKLTKKKKKKPSDVVSDKKPGKAANSNKDIKENLRGLMGQYAELKAKGKGNTKEAQAIGEQIGKIKNSLRKKKA